MIERARTYTIRLFSKWTEIIGHHAFFVLFLSLLATVGATIYTVNHFRIDTEMADMISDKLPYRKLVYFMPPYVISGAEIGLLMERTLDLVTHCS